MIQVEREREKRIADAMSKLLSNSKLTIGLVIKRKKFNFVRMTESLGN
jgi:hypothetical protein